MVATIAIPTINTGTPVTNVNPHRFLSFIKYTAISH
jgi:hypothetical protein